MWIFHKIGLGGTTLILSVLGVSLLLALTSGAMFNPGPLNGRVHPESEHKTIRSHAGLANQCSACHVSPWSSTTMEQKCLACHTSIQYQIDTKTSLHGKMNQAGKCLTCHTEHKGSQAEITHFHKFDHNDTNFPLTGKHVTVACKKCHQSTLYKLVSNTCASCHQEPLSHIQEKFGKDCAQCHNTTSWQTYNFQHAFPIHHAKAMQKNGCAACHDEGKAKADYSCYNCHKHEKNKTIAQHRRVPNIVNLDRCADCHPDGKKKIKKGQIAQNSLGLEFPLDGLGIEKNRCAANWPEGGPFP